MTTAVCTRCRRRDAAAAAAARCTEIRFATLTLPLRAPAGFAMLSRLLLLLPSPRGCCVLSAHAGWDRGRDWIFCDCGCDARGWVLGDTSFLSRGEVGVSGLG